jgi:hypothetical protein
MCVSLTLHSSCLLLISSEFNPFPEPALEKLNKMYSKHTLQSSYIQLNVTVKLANIGTAYS